MTDLRTERTHTASRHPDTTSRHSGLRYLPAAAVMLPARLFLGAGWLRAAVEKVIEPHWWSGDELDAFLATQHDHAVDWFVPIVDGLIAPNSALVAWIVVAVQIAVGMSMLTGRDLRAAVWAGIAMNTTFVLCGAVSPSAFYLVIELTLLLAMAKPVPWRTTLGRASWLGLISLVMVSFARTLSPSGVIDDPALMLSFVSALAAVGVVAVGDWARVPALRRLAEARVSRGR